MTELEQLLLAAVEQAMTMRAEQARYFKTRDRNALTVAKLAESKFDTMAGDAVRAARSAEESR